MKLKLKKNEYPGKLIVFEGTDGAGKTTLIKLAAEYLIEVFGKNDVVVTKQPTDMSRKTKLFQKMMYCSNHEDIDYRAVQLLTLSDRVQHGFEEIEPALKDGKFVICDRYIYTSVANMLARGYMDEKWFFEAAKNIVKPDITFLAHVPPELAIARIKARPEECNRHLDERQLRKVNAEFLKMRRSEGFDILDTSASAEKPFEIIKEHIIRTLAKNRIYIRQANVTTASSIL